MEIGFYGLIKTSRFIMQLWHYLPIYEIWDVAELKWRLIENEVMDPPAAMAFEEVSFGSCVENGKPLLHIWSWDRRAVSIGNFQVASDEVYLSRCRVEGIPVIRRISGGGTMFHERSPGALVYSIVVPAKDPLKGINGSYERFQKPVCDTLRDLGIPAWIKGNGIHVEGRKISGSAQRRIKGAILHHGTILFDVDEKEMFSYIKGKSAKMGEGTPSSYSPIVSISDLVQVRFGDLIGKMKDHLLTGQEYEMCDWSKEDLTRASNLVREKYSRDEWNLKL